MTHHPSTNNPSAPRRLGRLLVNHLGFRCEGRKEVIVIGAQDFETPGQGATE